MSRQQSTGSVERLLLGFKRMTDATALECGEMVMYPPIADPGDGNPAGLRVSRAVHEDCRGSLSLIRQLATQALGDGPGRPPRRLRLLAPVRSKRGARAAVVELVARARCGWVEVRMGARGS